MMYNRYTSVVYCFLVFLGELSACIFQWDKEDLDMLIKAKHSQLMIQYVDITSDSDV